MDNFVLEVYGESEYILLALKAVAAIFSFNDYMGLVYIFIVVGLFCAMIHFLYKVHIGFASLHLLLLHFIGATIVMTLCIVPKSTVTVHDMIKNRFTEVYKVPTVLAFTAWATNNIENGLKDVVIGAAGPINDPTIVGRGEAIELLAQLDKIPNILHVQDKTLTDSMSRYMVDCANLEIALGKIPVERLNYTNNLWQEFKSNNQAAFITVFIGDKDGTTKQTITCKDAYANISSRLIAKAGNAATTYCATHNFDKNNTFKCKNDLEFMLNSFVVGVSGQTTATDAIINMFVADAYTHAMALLSEQDPQSYGANQAYFKTVGGQYQSAIAAMKWLPAMIGMYRAMLLSVFPLCVLLVFVAPRKTTMWYLGGFTALVLWSVIDTILLSYFLTRLTNTFAEIQSTGLGVQQLLSLPSKSMQIVTQFGSARWGGMGLATAMTVGILGLTGHAFSNVAQGSAAGADSSARQEGAKFSGAQGSAAAYQDGLQNQTSMREVEGLRAISQTQHAAWGASHAVQNRMSHAGAADAKATGFGGDINAGMATGTYSGQSQTADVRGAMARSHALFGDASQTQALMDNMRANNGKLVADDAISAQLSNFGVQKGDILDMQLGEDGAISRLDISGTRDGKDYHKTIGGDGKIATDMETWKKGKDFRTLDRNNYMNDHSYKVDGSRVEDFSKTENYGKRYDYSSTTDGRTQSLSGDVVSEETSYQGAYQSIIEEGWSSSLSHVESSIKAHEDAKLELAAAQALYDSGVRSDELTDRLIVADRMEKQTESEMNKRKLALAQDLTSQINSTMFSSSSQEMESGAWNAGGSLQVALHGGIAAGRGMGSGGDGEGKGGAKKGTSAAASIGLKGQLEGHVGYEHVWTNVDTDNNNRVFSDMEKLIEYASSTDDFSGTMIGGVREYSQKFR